MFTFTIQYDYIHYNYFSYLCRFIKSSDKVYLNAQSHDLEGDEEYAYVYYMRFFNIISLIKKTKKYSEKKVSAQTVFQISFSERMGCFRNCLYPP